MSEEIFQKFKQNLELTLREEQMRADKLKSLTKKISISHLFCKCGKPLKDKLVNSLVVSSAISFEVFMTSFYSGLPESHDKITMILRTAKAKMRLPEIVFLETLAEASPIVTLHDVIDALQKAHLYRVIACMEVESGIQALLKHTSSHQNADCCVSASAIDTSVTSSNLLGESRLNVAKLPQPSTVPAKAGRGCILLTFMEDGRRHVERIKEVLQQPRGRSGRSYYVYTLSDFTQLITEDFLKNIVLVLSQVHFVVPIITEKYIQMLDELSIIDSSSIDEKYAPYVARLLLAALASSFKNKKIRCFRPKDVHWPANKFVYPPFYTAVTEPSDLPSILKTSKQ